MVELNEDVGESVSCVLETADATWLALPHPAVAITIMQATREMSAKPRNGDLRPITINLPRGRARTETHHRPASRP